MCERALKVCLQNSPYWQSQVCGSVKNYTPLRCQPGRSWHDALLPSSFSMIYDLINAFSEPCTAAASFLCFQPRAGMLILGQLRRLQVTLWHNFCTSAYGCWGQVQQFWHVFSSDAKTSVQLPFLRTCNAFAGRWMASNVTLKYGDLTETIPLFEGRLHIPTIKDAFTLRVAKIDGALAPVDSQGFTYAIFKPGDTLNISGTSAESAAMPGTPHSRGLLHWHLVPWYNMICTFNIPGTLQTAMMQSTSVFRASWGIVVFLVSGTLKGFTSEHHSGAILQIVKCIVDATSTLLQMGITCDCIA